MLKFVIVLNCQVPDQVWRAASANYSEPSLFSEPCAPSSLAQSSLSFVPCHGILAAGPTL